MTIRILLADDHHMVREALRDRLNLEPDFAVVAEASTGGEALHIMKRDHPDVAVLDIALPEMSGIEVARHISTRYPGIGIVALSGYTDRVFVEEMFKAGALGYVVKSADTMELFAAIRAVARGKRFLCSDLTGLLLSNTSIQGTEATPPATVLTPREREVLRLLAKGKRATEIATDLGIAIATVEVHRRNIKDKVGVRTTAELTRYAIREGLAAS